MMEKSTAPSERDAELASSSATKAEYAKEYDQAFRLYLKAAEYYLRLSRSLPALEKQKHQWKLSAGKCLDRAKKIKDFSESSRDPKNVTTSQPSLRLTPVGIDHFSPQEQLYVLKKGGRVNNISYSLWDDPVPTRNLVGTYSDPDGQPALSPEQEEVHPIWRRHKITTSAHSSVGRKILPQQILQHIVTDCSVCASISVCLEHGRRFDSTLESALRSSFENSDRVPGRYDVRIFFNGAWRRVLIDDQLPFYPTEDTLMCMSVLPQPPLGNISESESITLWPSLLEKAYMKLMGGYDFPGSNSSIDLHALAGWIPEYIDLQGSEFEREKTWQRVERGFASGKCVVTLGTGMANDAHWRNTPLLPSHSYAVIDVYESATDGRVLNVLDSWVHRSDGQPELARELHISWAEVVNIFSGVYLSWDPRIWKNSLDFHGIWKRNAEDEEGTKHLQLQFNCASNADEEIWILLTRHLVNTRRTTDFAALRVELEDDLIPVESVAENQRAVSSKGTYTNSTHILVRKRVPAYQRHGNLSISASYDGDAREVGFTVTVLSGVGTHIAWVKNKDPPPYTSTIDGTFTSKNSGGNCTYPTFMINPQYQVTIHPHAQLGPKAKLSLNLQTSREVPTNLAIVWSQNQRVTELSAKDLVATSGAYNYGSARISQNINVGSYIVVVSAFEPHHMGRFSLKVDSSHPFDMKPIPQEGAGMYCKVVRGTWDAQTAGGSPSFKNYAKNPVFEIVVPTSTQLRIRLHSVQPAAAVALNVTVYPRHQDGVAASLKGQLVATSGAYDDGVAGVATPQVSLSAGRYYVIPSTYNPGTFGGFRMLVYSSISSIQVNAAG